MVELNVTCEYCSEEQCLQVGELELLEFMLPGRRGVEVLFPHLTAPEREILISGMCPKCWDSIIGLDLDEEFAEV